MEGNTKEKGLCYSAATGGIHEVVLELAEADHPIVVQIELLHHLLSRSIFESTYSKQLHTRNTPELCKELALLLLFSFCFSSLSLSLSVSVASCNSHQDKSKPQEKIVWVAAECCRY